MNPIKLFWKFLEFPRFHVAAAAIGGSALVGLAGSVYGADQARSAANTATDAANRANELALHPLSTGSSSINRGAGTVSIDPSIRALRDSTLANLPAYRANLGNAYTNFQGQLGGIYGQLQGNQNALVTAAQAPILQQQASQSGALQSDLGLRGLSGSSFGNQALTNLNTDYSTAAGNAGVNALQTSLGAQAGIAGQQFGASQALNQGNLQIDQQQQGVAGQDLAQELSALGLSQADVGSILQSGALAQQAQLGYANNVGRSVGSLGQLATGLSPYTKYLNSNSANNPANNPTYNAQAD